MKTVNQTEASKLVNEILGLGISQYNIAKTLNVLPATVRWWKQGIFNPKKNNLEKLKNFLSHAKKAGVACLLIFILSPQAQGAIEYGKASWYSVEACKFNIEPKTCKTADGTPLRTLEGNKILFGASPNLPFKSRVRITNLENNKSVVVEIRDRGPNLRLNRIIDLGKLAFEQIADTRTGIIKVKAEVIS